MVRDGIGDLLGYAHGAGMPLAIEPLHPMYAADRACVNTMAHANDLCDELGAGVGIAVDAYHVWWDPHLKREIERAGGSSPSRLLAYHICDWLVPTTDLLTDRGMMGDGVIDLRLAALVDGRARISRLPRGRDLLRQQLVEARSGRSAGHLQGAARRM